MNSLFKLGHPLIDQQHADLHRSLQRLRAMLDAGASVSDVGDEFSSLSRKICAHFADEEAANSRDPVLALVEPLRRPTLLARREDREGGAVYRFDIRLQGEDETVFFDV